MPHRLNKKELDTLLEFSTRGPGGDFDPQALAKLFRLGMIELQPADRRLALTDEGRRVCNIVKPVSGARPHVAPVQKPGAGAPGVFE